MIVCPCGMNLFQYWIQDSFLKNKQEGRDEGEDSEEDGRSDDGRYLL